LAATDLESGRPDRNRGLQLANGPLNCLPAPVLSRRFQEAGRYDIALALLESRSARKDR